VPGNVPSFVASRVAYIYNLRGPSYVSSSTCASSLLALHEACLGLIHGDCELALVGGVNLFPFPINAQKIFMNAAGIMSDDQRCRPFDQHANGIGRGEGVAALLLKPLEKALADHDHIHAVILSSAVNNDGLSAGITAPNPRAHTELLLEAWKRADITPESLSYIEAHGTGTHLGDPIEVRGITDAVRQYTNKRQFIAMGSVKGNIGHLLDGVAGLSGLLKVLHILKHGIVPATKHLQEPNRYIDFLDSPVFVPDQPWDLQANRQAETPLRAGVSCFGFNGTNVHVVLEEAPTVPSKQTSSEQETFVFPLSARSSDSLHTLVTKYAQLDEHTYDLSARDVSYTLWSGRDHFAYSVAFIASSMQNLVMLCKELASLPFEQWQKNEQVFLCRDHQDDVKPGDQQKIEEEYKKLAQEYVSGKIGAWHRLFEHKEVYKVSLPTYAFDEHSYWVSLKRPVATQNIGVEREDASELDKVLAIVRDILEISDVRAEDNFLAKGGNSLSALQLISRLRKELHMQIKHEDLLGAPDFQSLVANVVNSQSMQITQPLESQRTKEQQQYPLSFAQQRFWFLEQMESDHAFYNIPLTARLKGVLNVEAMQRSLTEIQRRHQILRSTYPLDETGRPYVTIHANSPAPLPIINLQHLPVEEGEKQAAMLAKEALIKPFSLEQGPIWHASLYKLDEQDHLLLIVMHHIITDIWSFNLFVQELSSLYQAYLEHKPSPLPELPLQYTDFSVWQHQYFHSPAFEKVSQYWKQQLSAYRKPLELPTDKPRGTVRSLNGKTLPIAFPEQLSQVVKERATAEGVTTFMFLLSIFSILLYRYSGQDDIVIGTEVANRTMDHTESLIGAFVNQLALRVSLTGNPTYKELLQRTRKVTLEAYEHQDMPFDKLVDLLKPERSANTTPFFLVKFLFENATRREQELPGLISEAVDIFDYTSPFDITLRLCEERTPLNTPRITGSLTYNSDLFTEQTIAQFLEHFHIILEQVLQQPDIYLSQIEMLSQCEKEKKMQEAREREELKQKSLRRFSRKSAQSTLKQLVRTSFLQAGDRFPLVIEPTISDVDLADWIKNNHSFIETKIIEHGAVLFHNFKISSVKQFQQIALAVHPQLVEYSEPSTPRAEYMDKVYVSSEYPNYYAIPLHGELSYTYRWPMKALFYCKKAAAKGGETPIADAREVFKRIDPRVREKFIEKQIMYLRNYGDGLLVPWEKVFQTTDRNVVEVHCRNNPPMWCEWLGENRLRTRQIRPAIAVHPVTGDTVWFNQAHIFHIYSLGSDIQQKLLAQFGADNLPVNALYGDGTTIENWELDSIYQAYKDSMYAFPWQEGDILLADNMLMSHGRNPFEGPREVVVSFVEPCPDQVQLKQYA
jgi:3-oxoacyl-(acyl-carrier-protein) synthase/alpha-ketoglutarate-dependent taurine dioxygenase/acyl carrier protein